MWPFSWFRKKQQPAGQKQGGSSLLIGTGDTETPSRNQKALSEEGYKKNAIGYRAVSLVARGVASVPWVAYINDKEVDDHPILDLLMTKANYHQSGAFVQESIASFYLLTGNAYPRVIRAGSVQDQRAPKELYSLRPDRVTVLTDKTGVVIGYGYRVKNNTTKFLLRSTSEGTISSDVWHFRTFNPLNDYYGMSPFEPAAYAIDQHNAGSRYNYNLLKNHARPSGVFKHTPNEYAATLGDDQYNRLKKEIDDKWAGEVNAGKPHLLEGGLDWQETSWSPRDVDWLEGRNVAGREIAMAEGVPPMLAGIRGDATYANFKEANTSLWENTINSVLSVFQNGYNTWLVPMYNTPGLRVEYNLDEIPAIAEKRRDIWQKLESVTFLSVNEKREAVGYEPQDGGDEILVSGLLMPLSEVGAGTEEVIAEEEAEELDPEEAASIGYGRKR